jgi:spermidine/putrescine transport system substrate-binding protein
MGNAEVLAQFSEEELDALQWDSLEEDLSRCSDYNVVPRYDEMVELYSQALREA